VQEFSLQLTITLIETSYEGHISPENLSFSHYDFSISSRYQNREIGMTKGQIFERNVALVTRLIKFIVGCKENLCTSIISAFFRHCTASSCTMSDIVQNDNIVHDIYFIYIK
jgi:hypothetical protein